MHKHEHDTLGGQLADSIRTMILNGSLGPGRINEVHLASELGVSRTPLREALSRLITEGAVSNIPRHGVYVTPLTERELEELYPLRGILDPAALRLAGLPSAKRLERLKDLNRHFAAARSTAQAVSLDDQWHRELLGDANPVLLGFIEQIIWRTRRYEIGLMHGKANVSKAAQQHAFIIDALEKGDLDRGCELLRQNMSSGKEPIIEWLRSREKADG